MAAFHTLLIVEVRQPALKKLEGHPSLHRALVVQPKLLLELLIEAAWMPHRTNEEKVPFCGVVCVAAYCYGQPFLLLLSPRHPLSQDGLRRRNSEEENAVSSMSNTLCRS